MKKGWEIKRLDDVVEFQRGLTYSKKDEVEFSENIVLRSNNVDLFRNQLDFSELKYINSSIEIPENKKVKKGSLLICTANGSKSHLGKVALIDDDYNYAFGGFMGLINPKQKLDSKFLFYLMTSDNCKKFINELSDGANINNLKFGDLGQFEIPIPPLAEQQRIVSILDESFAAIDKAKANAEQNLKNAKELFESYLEGVFESDDGDWEKQTIQGISKVINGFAFSSKDFKPNNTVKSVKITNVGVNKFVEEEDNYLPENFNFKMKDYIVREGNIVIALTRTIISAGLKVAIVPKSYDGALLNQRVAALVPHEEQVNDKYLYYYLCTHIVVEYVLKHVNTLMQPNLSINDLKDMPIPIPPLHEQQSIVQKLDALRTETQKLEAVYKKKIEDLEELKKSILQRAFAGELPGAEAMVSISR